MRSATLASFAAALLIAFIAGRAQANPDILTINGVTSDGSSLDGTPIASGIDYQIIADFDTSTGLPVFGGNAYVYLPSLETISVGSNVYTDQNPSEILVGLSGPPAISTYWVDLMNQADGSNLGTFFSTSTTPSFSFASPSPTVFMDPSGFTGSPIDFTVDNSMVGGLVLDTDPSGNGWTSASIASVPEPSTLVGMLSFVGVGLIVLLVRHRRWAV